MAADRCPACEQPVTVASARWCGRCGARLDRTPAGPDQTAPRTGTFGPSGRTPTQAAGLAGATGTLVRGDIIPGIDDPPPAEPEEAVAAPPPGRVLRVRLAAAAVAVVAVAAVLALQPEPEVVYPDAGYAEGGGPARTGRVSHAPLDALPTDVAWEVDLDVDALNVLSHVEVHDGLVIEHGHRVVGRDPASGAVRWVGPGRETARTRGVVVDGLYIQTSSSGTYALDGETGRRVWEASTEGSRVFAVPGESAVLVQRQDALILLDATDGSRRWIRDVRDGLPGVPSVGILDVLSGDDEIVVSGSTPAGLAPDNPRAIPVVLSLTARDGLVRWTRVVDPLPEDTLFPVTAHAGGLTAVVEGPRITVLGGDGEPVGEPVLRDFDGPVSMVEAGDDPVLVLGNGLTVTGVDPVTGEVRWESTVPAQAGVGVSSRLDTQAGGRIIVTTAEVSGGRVRVHTIDPRDGATRLVVEQDDATFSMAWLDRDDRPAVVTGVEGGDRYRVSYLDTGAAWEATPATTVGGGPSVRDGLVVAPTRIGGVAVALESGEVRWRADVGSADTRPFSFWATPAIGEAAVALGPQHDVGAPRDRLAGFDLASGVTAWSRSDDSEPPRGRITLAGDRAFVPVGKEIHAYDLVTGRRAFAARSVDGIGALAVAGSHVIGAPDLDSRVPVFARQAVGIDRSTRSMRWRQDAPNACTAPTVALDASRLPVAASTSSDPVTIDLALWGTTEGIRAVDAATGDLVWEDTASGPVCRDLAVAGDRVIAAASFDTGIVDGRVITGPVTNRLASLSLETGRVGWTTELPGPVVTAPVLAGEVAIVGLASQQLAAVDTETGEVIDVVDLDGVPAAPPAVSDRGEVVVLLTDGRLVALR